MGLGSIIKSLYMSYAGGTLGTMVFRAASLPTASSVPLPIFTVTGGNVLMTMLVGETIAPDTTGASNLSIQIDPVAAGAAVALCGATVINNDVAGTLYTFTGVPGDGCYADLAVPAGMAGGLVAQGFHGWIIPIGDVEWIESNAGPDHTVQWTMFYVPIDRGATVAFA